MRHLQSVILWLLLFVPSMAMAQCELENTAFKSGEVLSYNLYYNWKFVWVKVGTGSMTTQASRYEGKDAFKCSLITRGNGKLDKFFVMRDTLTSYITPSLVPLYFRKGAEEGEKYTVDEVWYSYKGSQCSVKLHRQHKNGTHRWSNEKKNECIFDMLNIFVRARSYNTAGWTKGKIIKFPIADGKDVTTAQLKYEGKETVKGDDGVKYRCLRFSYAEWDKKKKKYKEFGRLYATDDANHVPVRIDMTLNFGVAKAFLTHTKGLRNNTTSKI